MDFALSEEERLLVSTVRRFVETELQPLEAEVEASGELAPDRAAAIFDKSRALGLYAMNMPTELGGGGLSRVFLAEESLLQLPLILGLNLLAVAWAIASTARAVQTLALVIWIVALASAITVQFAIEPSA